MSVVSPVNNSPVVEQLIVADLNSTELGLLLQDAQVPTLGLRSDLHPLVQITEALAGKQIDALHLVGHGRHGAIQLGECWIDARETLAYLPYILEWQVRTIALWGCDIGRDSPIVHALIKMTGAFVYTSDQPLGMTDNGPNWMLAGGFPKELVPFSKSTMQQWLNTAVDTRSARRGIPQDLHAQDIVPHAGIEVSKAPLQALGTKRRQVLEHSLFQIGRAHV